MPCALNRHSYYRVLRYLAYYKSVGVLTLVVNFMLVDVAVFATMLFLITIGFGFAFATLLPKQNEDNRVHLFLGGNPVWSSWWGLFGDCAWACRNSSTSSLHLARPPAASLHVLARECR